jgi:hypothetical protein
MSLLIHVVVAAAAMCANDALYTFQTHAIAKGKPVRGANIGAALDVASFVKTTSGPIIAFEYWTNHHDPWGAIAILGACMISSWVTAYYAIKTTNSWGAPRECVPQDS